MEPVNPYAPPTADLGSIAARSLTPDEIGRARWERTLWIAFFELNLVVPGLFAAGVLAPAGWLGLLAAVVLLGGGGFALLRAYPRRTGVASAGAGAMALTQFVPFLQIMAGMLGTGLAGLLGPTIDQQQGDRFQPLQLNLNLIQGFVATLVAGSALLAASVVIGLLLRIGQSWWRGASRTGGILDPGHLHERSADA